MSHPNLTPVSECDYLEDDKPIRGQNYVCLSFISPEEVLANKEVFIFNKYIEAFSTQMNQLFTNLIAKYPDDKGLFETIQENNSHIFKGGEELQDHFRFYKDSSNAENEKEFHEKNNFQTSIRGIKVRGTYDTFKEADIRAQVLKRSGDKFNIYVAQVGCWCPWSPNPDDIANQEYSQSSLNTLMKQYNENVANKDNMYEIRKQTKLQTARVATEKEKAALEESDAWMNRMRENLSKTTVSDTEQTAVAEQTVTPGVTEQTAVTEQAVSEST